MKIYEKFTKQELEDIINNSITYREVMNKLGYKDNKIGSITTLKEISNKYNISIQHLKTKARDLRGQQFGYLTVLEMDKNRKGSQNQVYWICKCQCGTIKSIRGTDLTSDKSHSCGCNGAYSNSKIQIGSKSGKLLILDIFIDTNGKKVAKCKCDCGNECIKPYHSILSKHTQSCGCLVSKGENKIKELLTELKINFEQQKQYENLIGIQKPLSFDFYLPDFNICIEYQGQQHYEPMRFTNSMEKFEQNQKNDNKKREYCKNNNIKLIEIPYTDYNILNQEYLLNLINQ